MPSVSIAMGGEQTSFDVTFNGMKLPKDDDIDLSSSIVAGTIVGFGIQSRATNSSGYVSVQVGVNGASTGSHELVPFADAEPDDASTGSSVQVAFPQNGQTLSYDAQSGTMNVDTVTLSTPAADGTQEVVEVKGSFQGSFGLHVSVFDDDSTPDAGPAKASISGTFHYVALD